MAESVIEYLGSQPILQIVRGLMSSHNQQDPHQLHLRELAGQYSLSPSGVSDILYRLKKAGVLSERRIGNRRCLALNLAEDEIACLEQLFSVYEKRIIEKRSKRFSRRAVEKLKWMDEAYAYYRNLKRAWDDTT